MLELAASLVIRRDAVARFWRRACALRITIGRGEPDCDPIGSALAGRIGVTLRSVLRRVLRRPDESPCALGTVGGGTWYSGSGGVFCRRSGGGQQHFQRSEEHTSELQSHVNLVCRLL